MAFAAGSHVWIPDPDEVVIPALVETSFSPGAAGKVTRLDNERTVKLGAADTKNVTQMHEQCLEGVDDMVTFKELDEFSILHNLRIRYYDDIIYTNIGRILTSVNPFKQLPIYSPSVMDEYMEKGSRNMPPHVYGVADDAFTAMIDNQKSQSCIVSGESGAGKTEATKIFLQFISEKSKRQSANASGSDTNLGHEMQQKILEANPLMEAFGNAKTVRNDNSSRFGKWIEIQFDRHSGSIVGGSIKSYLLEKSRIVNQANNERNYHIFYQFCTAAEINPDLEKYNLSDASQYYYLNQSDDPCTKVESIDDMQEWGATMNAMEKIGVSDEERHEILNILNVVLTIGNTTFTGTEVSAVDNMSVVQKTSEMIGCDPAILERALIKVDRSNPADPNLVGNHDLSQACDARDAFAKHIYSLLFDWIIVKINVALGRVADSPKISTIGVLDIFGFEFFQNNSFEQLCINYCNERLQGHFNDHIFKLEQEQYAKEGIDVTKIEFVDNENVIQTIDSRMGILQIIADELKLNTATDQTLLKKLKSQADKVKNDPRMNVLSYPDNKEVKKNPDLDNVFRVSHYAGQVTYRIEQFLEKNRDAVPKLLQKLGEGCKNGFIKALFKNAGAAKKKALGLRFSAQLKDLMNDLNATEPHYVRCVKPNSEKEKENFTAPMILSQLRYAGLLEVCRIRQMGYPVRRGHEEFYKRYRHLAKGAFKDHMGLIEALKKASLMAENKYQVGTTKVFLKTDQADKLEEERAVSLAHWVKNMQRVVRGFLIRVVSKQWQKIRQDLRDAIASREKEMLKTALLGYGSLPYGGRHLKEYREGNDLMNKIEDEERIQQLLADAIASRDINQIQVALKAAEEKNLGKSKEANDARQLMALIEKENVAKQALREAIEAKDEAALKNAVQMAKGLDLVDLALCKDAEALLKAIDRERVCRKNLEEAIANKDVNRIRQFMNQMADMGKADDPLVHQGEELCQENAKAAAEVQARKEALLFNLHKAIKERNLQGLNDLEMEIIELGLDNDVTREAKELRDTLQQEMDICAKLNAESTAVNAKAQTRVGLVESDLETLRTLIEDAEDVLEADDFQLLSAKEDLYKLEKQLEVQNELSSALDSYTKQRAEFAQEKDKEKRVELQKAMLTALKDANNRAVETGAEIQTAVEIKEKLNQLQQELDQGQREEREAQKAANIARLQEATEDEIIAAQAVRDNFANVLSEKHKALVAEASDANRYNISRYFRIRSNDDYVEKVASDLKVTAAKLKLISQPKPILKSLCRLDKKENDLAIKINRAILQYCGDIAVTFPATMAQFVLIKGLEDTGMTDEIFLQLMKHIIGNPKPESADRAWLLMCMATKTFPPPAEFAPFLLNFFITRKTTPGLIGNYARLCIVQLDATMELGPTWFKPNIEEIQNYRKRPPILASIYTLEGKQIDYPVTPDMRVSQVLDLIKRKENVEDEADHPVWGIYVAPQDEEEAESPKERLIRFYQHYNPAKIAHVDLFLDHWKNNIEELFQKLVFKYGPEPTEDDKTKRRGMLSLPITAAMNAVKFLGFANQREQPPAPETSWPLPWWTHLGDVYYRMSKQKRVPRFVFKRRMITRQEPVDKWLYLQAVDDIRQGYLPVQEMKTASYLAALALMYEHGAEAVKKELTVPALKDLGFEKFVPNVALREGRLDAMINEAIDMYNANKIPDNQEKIMEEFVLKCRENPVYGMNYFYARHSASEKNYVIAVDVEGIHVLEEDRTDVKRSFGFDTIKKFGATAEYFWMNIDERPEPEKQGRFKFLSGNQGINVLLYTLQSWEMYDCVYDATHIDVDEEGM